MELELARGDITYSSELTPPLAFCKNAAGLIRPSNLRSFHSVSLGLIKYGHKKI